MTRKHKSESNENAEQAIIVQDCCIMIDATFVGFTKGDVVTDSEIIAKLNEQGLVQIIQEEGK
jgi:hypothetical protein